MLKAAVDIGTNSTRLFIADINGKIKRIEKHTTITRLGKMVDKERKLGAKGIEKNVSVLLEYKKIADSYGIHDIKAIATSAVRDAVNKNEFVDTIFDRCGIKVDVISGEEEAKLGFLGASSVLKEGYGVVCDIGGGSTELICGNNGKIQISESIDIGAVRMTERYLNPDIVKRGEISRAYGYIKEVTFKTIEKMKNIKDFTLIGIGGTITTLAAIDQELTVYDIDRVHGYKLYKERVDSIFERLTSLNLEGRKKVPGLQSERADIITAGILILKTIMEELGSECMIVSESDNLDGLMIMGD